MQPTVLFRPSMKHRLMRPEELVLERGADGRLWARRGPEARPVVVRRCFPWSETSRYISLRDDDQAEVALVKDPMELPPSSRQALVEAPAEAGVVFDVSRVIEGEEAGEIRHWRGGTREGGRGCPRRP